MAGSSNPAINKRLGELAIGVLPGKGTKHAGIGGQRITWDSFGGTVFGRKNRTCDGSRQRAHADCGGTIPKSARTSLLREPIFKKETRGAHGNQS